AAYLLLGLAWVLSSRDGIDPQGKPLGADFITFYAASDLMLRGEAAAAYDPATIFAAEQRAVPADTEVFPSLYPPAFGLVVLPLALLPYGLALLAFMAATVALYLCLVQATLPGGRALVAALAFSAAFVNALGGQNGFLSTALLGGGLLLLEGRPVIAGALFG